MLNTIKDFFMFNKRQERGVFVLSLILIIVIVLNHFAPQLAPDLPKHILENAQYIKQIKLQKIDEPTKYKEFNNKALKHLTNSDQQLNIYPKSSFDPNTVHLDTLLQMGLPKYIASNIIKYRNSGGRFYKKEDLKKIYGLNDEIYQSVEAYAIIEKKNKFPKKKIRVNSISNKEKKLNLNNTKTQVKKVYLGINLADSIQLLNVVGIGPYYAGAIVKYRTKLGGFNNLLQLKELYKMNDEKYDRIKTQLFLDTVLLKKIPINTVEFKVLLRHPYVDYETTKYIINKRKRLGKYAALYQLKDSTYLPENKYKKLLPYLILD